MMICCIYVIHLFKNTAKEANTETVDNTSCELKCKECELVFDNIKGMRDHKVQMHRVNRNPDRWLK